MFGHALKGKHGFAWCASGSCRSIQHALMLAYCGYTGIIAMGQILYLNDSILSFWLFSRFPLHFIL